MGSEWQIKCFDTAPLEIIDGDRGKNYPGQTEFSASGYCLFLNAGNVTSNGFNFSDCAFVTEAKDSLLRKGKLIRKDVILTTRGTVGNTAFFDNTIPFEHIRINSGMVILRPKPSDLLPRYLYLFVRSPYFHSQVLALRTGSAQPQLPIRDIKKIQIPIPPLPEQSAIAHILGSLDDKIELNLKMNETLEAMARAIFKSWFVDFDPVRAKAEGRDPGLPKAIADLFPDSFEDSELGQIPKGWEVSTIGENSKKLSKGTTPRKNDVLSASDTPTIPFLKVRNISDTGEIDLSNIEKVPRSIHEGFLKRSILRTNDLLFSIAGTIGRVSILPKELNDSNTNQAIAFVRPKKNELPATFIRLILISDRIQYEANSRVVQGVQANVSLTVLRYSRKLCLRH